MPKTQSAARELAANRLRRATWVTSNGVDLGDCARIVGNEDDFDAQIAAAAVLRCLIEAITPARSRAADTSSAGHEVGGTRTSHRRASTRQFLEIRYRIFRRA